MVSADVDEPLLSGTGLVSKDCSEGELEGWATALAKWRQAGLGQSAPRSLWPLVRGSGIPEALRGEVWQLLAGAAQDPQAAQAYRLLLARDCPCDGVIQRDVHRTFPAHEFFRESGGAGQDSLYKICKAYAVQDPEVGYCQGLSFLAAALLLHVSLLPWCSQRKLFFQPTRTVSNCRCRRRRPLESSARL